MKLLRYNQQKWHQMEETQMKIEYEVNNLSYVESCHRSVVFQVYSYGCVYNYGVDNLICFNLKTLNKSNYDFF